MGQETVYSNSLLYFSADLGLEREPYQKKAFFVTELIGRAGDITNGNYSVGASGTMIENGEFAYAVNEVTIANNLVDMFKNLIPMNDLELKTSTNSPSLMIDTMTVAGK